MESRPINTKPLSQTIKEQGAFFHSSLPPGQKTVDIVREAVRNNADKMDFPVNGPHDIKLKEIFGIPA